MDPRYFTLGTAEFQMQRKCKIALGKWWKQTNQWFAEVWYQDSSRRFRLYRRCSQVFWTGCWGVFRLKANCSPRGTSAPFGWGSPSFVYRDPPFGTCSARPPACAEFLARSWRSPQRWSARSPRRLSRSASASIWYSALASLQRTMVTLFQSLAKRCFSCVLFSFSTNPDWTGYNRLNDNSGFDRGSYTFSFSHWQQRPRKIGTRLIKVLVCKSQPINVRAQKPSYVTASRTPISPKQKGENLKILNKFHSLSLPQHFFFLLPNAQFFQFTARFKRIRRYSGRLLVPRESRDIKGIRGRITINCNKCGRYFRGRWGRGWSEVNHFTGTMEQFRPQQGTVNCFADKDRSKL